MSAVINAILDATAFGYKVEFDRFNSYERITCIHEKYGSYSSVIPLDHFYEPTIVEIIEFNIERIKPKKKKNDKS